MQKEFEEELTALINKHSRENESNTPDFIIARFMIDAYYAFVKGVNRRAQWYGVNGEGRAGTGGTQEI